MIVGQRCCGRALPRRLGVLLLLGGATRLRRHGGVVSGQRERFLHAVPHQRQRFHRHTGFGFGWGSDRGVGGGGLDGESKVVCKIVEINWWDFGTCSKREITEETTLTHTHKPRPHRHTGTPTIVHFHTQSIPERLLFR